MIRVLIPHIPGVREGIVQDDDRILVTTKCCGGSLIDNDDNWQLKCSLCSREYPDSELPPHPSGGTCGGVMHLAYHRGNEILIQKWIEVWTGLSIELEISW